LKVTDASGCSLERQYNLAAAKTIEISLTQKEDASCKKQTGSALIEVSGADGDYRITWSDGVSGITKRDDLLPGSYTVSAVNTSGCEVSTSFEIKATIEITARIESMLDVNCAVGSVTGVAWVSIQGGKEPYTIIWKSGEKEMREINFFQSGILKVLIKDASGCTLEVESKVDFPSQNGQGARLDFNYRKLEITNDPEVQVKQEVIFESMISEEFIAWEWAFGDGNISKDKDPIHRFEAAGEFEVILTAYDIFGCASTESNRIQVSSPAQLVAVPNAFTPNGDGLNDTFIPKIKAVSTFSMDIFNTWGERIYSTIGPESSGWDGTYQGQALPVGNYLYRINYSSRDGKVFEKTGGITLIR
jgi:gliding motility-associated-like protein